MNYSIYVGFNGVGTELNVSACSKREFAYVYVRRHLAPAISTNFWCIVWGLGDVVFASERLRFTLIHPIMSSKAVAVLMLCLYRYA